MVDYSKWKNIEISDDEDDTHPNIDTPSLFRWRHQARLERMAELDREKEDFKRRKQSYQARLTEVKDRLNKKTGDKEQLEKELEKIEKEGREIDKIENDLSKKDKKTPWNVDTISKPGFEKTVLNKMPARKSDDQLTDEERESRMKNFVKENENLCKQYGMMSKYDDSKRFLQQNLHLVCDETANYLVIWSINLVIEEKFELMSYVAHQCICMQYILELGKQLDVDPRACVSSFFTKIQNCVPEYREQFESEISGFKNRVKKRAAEKIQEIIAEEEEEDRKNRLGPGGLDPVDVFDHLPEELQKCFETRDIELLQKTIAALPVDDAKFHMKRCVDSGLWIPNASDGIDINNDEIIHDIKTTSVNTENETKHTADKDQTKTEVNMYKSVSTDDLD